MSTQPELIHVSKLGFSHDLSSHFNALRKAIGMPEKATDECREFTPHKTINHLCADCGETRAAHRREP